MKSFKEFLAEARVSAGKLERSVNKKNHTFDELEKKDQDKLVQLYSDLLALEKNPKASTGALAKDFTKADKAISSFAGKFGLTVPEMLKAKKMAK